MTGAITAKARYVTRIPRKPLPEGEILVHNHVLPAPRLGERGFRAWTQRLDETPAVEVCGCDWAGVDLRGLTHYRVSGIPATRSGPVPTSEE